MMADVVSDNKMPLTALLKDIATIVRMAIISTYPVAANASALLSCMISTQYAEIGVSTRFT
jgi:hypothetical protein